MLLQSSPFLWKREAETCWHPAACLMASPMGPTAFGILLPCIKPDPWYGLWVQSPPGQAGLSPIPTTPDQDPSPYFPSKGTRAGLLLTGTCRSGGGLCSGTTVSTQVIFSMSTEPFLLPRRCKTQAWFE